MKTKIIDNWEVELINDRGDTLTLKGEWYADFFKEYENKQLIIADVGRSEQLVCDKCGYPLRWVAVSERTPENNALCLCATEYGYSFRYWKVNHFEGEHVVNEPKVTHWMYAPDPPCV